VFVGVVEACEDVDCVHELWGFSLCFALVGGGELVGALRRTFNFRFAKIKRSQCERIRTAGEIKANIILPPLDNVALYHKIREKVASLRALGMSFGAIAKSLSLNEKTVRKAFYNKHEQKK
jgi:hypothetical protein